MKRDTSRFKHPLTKNDGQILMKGRGLKVVVHPVCAGQELLEVLEPDVERNAHADGRPQGVTSWGQNVDAIHILV